MRKFDWISIILAVLKSSVLKELLIFMILDRNTLVMCFTTRFGFCLTGPPLWGYVLQVRMDFQRSFGDYNSRF